MSDDPQIGQDEIEELLRQAQGEAAGGAKPETPAAATTPANDDDSQDANETPSQTTSPDAAIETAVEKPTAGATQTVDTTPPTPPTATAKRAEPSDDIAPGDIELLLRQAQAAIASVDQPRAQASHAKEFRLKDFAGASASAERSTLELIRDVELDLKIELGRTHMPLDEVLRLQKGSVVPLEKLAGDPVDIFVNGRLIARGEVLVMNDNFCVRVAELVASEAVA